MEINVLPLFVFDRRRFIITSPRLPAELAVSQRPSLLVPWFPGFSPGAPNSGSPRRAFVSLLKQVTSLDHACFLICQTNPWGWFGLSGQVWKPPALAWHGVTPTEGALITFVRHLLRPPLGL